MGVRQPATAQLSSQYIKIIHFFYTLLIFISNYTIVCKSWADGICEVTHYEWCHNKLCDSCRRTFHKVWWEISNWEGVRILAGMGVNCCCVAVTLWIAKFSCIFLQLPDQANLDICIITIRKACMFPISLLFFLQSLSMSPWVTLSPIQPSKTIAGAGNVRISATFAPFSDLIDQRIVLTPESIPAPGAAAPLTWVRYN